MPNIFLHYIPFDNSNCGLIKKRSSELIIHILNISINKSIDTYTTRIGPSNIMIQKRRRKMK